jgi:AraC-like DNA-binding protein
MLSHEEIERAITRLCQTPHNESFRLHDSETGLIAVDVVKESWYSMIQSRFENLQLDLCLPFQRQHPMILMFFQRKGHSSFIRQHAAEIPEHSHSLNYLPEFDANFLLDKGSESHYVAIKIDPVAVANHFRENDPDDPIVRFFGKKDPFFTLNSSQRINPFIQRSLHELLNCPYKDTLQRFYKENIIRNLLIHQLAAFMPGELDALNHEPVMHKRDRDVMNEIKLYLDEHYLEVQSLNDLSRRFCINTFKLKNGFKKMFGMPVMKYIDDHKMNYARNVLLQTETAIIDIADELGYQHYNNFSTAFKRKFGYSPLAVKNA